MVANAGPGVALGFILGWEPLAAVLLGGVTWISSSGIISKVLADLGRLANRETPAILNLLVIEDLAMAVYLPVVAALIVGGTVEAMTTSVVIALATVIVILVAALRYGSKFTSLLGGGSDESLLLAVLGVTLLVAGLAQSLEVSGAIGAFLVGLALSGPVAERVERLISPLQDLFAATFFLFFSFQIDPADLFDAAIPAIGLALVTMSTKLATGWFAGARVGAGAARSRPCRHRADGPRRVLDRHRSARRRPGRRTRARRACSRIRARDRHRRPGGHPLRRPDPPRAPREDAARAEPPRTSPPTRLPLASAP